ESLVGTNVGSTDERGHWLGILGWLIRSHPLLNARLHRRLDVARCEWCGHAAASCKSSSRSTCSYMSSPEGTVPKLTRYDSRCGISVSIVGTPISVRVSRVMRSVLVFARTFVSRT